MGGLSGSFLFCETQAHQIPSCALLGGPNRSKCLCGPESGQRVPLRASLTTAQTGDIRGAAQPVDSEAAVRNHGALTHMTAQGAQTHG